MNAYLFLLAFYISLKYVSSFVINQPLKYCSIEADAKYWDRAYKCNNFNTQKFKGLKPPYLYDSSKEYAVMSKSHDIVSGYAIQCSIKKHIKRMTMSFFGMRYTETDVSYEQMPKEECHIMSKTKQCKGKTMICPLPSRCKYIPQITADYKWFSTTTVTEYECHITPRTLSAKKLDDNLFGTMCKAKDLYCRLDDSIMVWDESVMHKCPFSKIVQMEFKFNIENAVAYNMTEKLLFQLLPVEKHCETDMIPTQEGLYLIDISSKGKELSRNFAERMAKMSKPVLKYPLDTNDVSDLTLANMDFDHYIDLKNYATVKNQQCNNFISLLNIISGLEDVFTKAYIRDSGEIILYSTGGNIILPKCIPVSNVQVLERTKECYEDLPVTFKLNENVTMNGFLTKSIILVKFSKKIECYEQSKAKRYVMGNGDILIQEKNSVRLDRKSKTISILHRDTDIFNPNFHHSVLITNGVDTSAYIPDLSEVEEISGMFLVAPNENYRTTNLLETNKIREVFFKIISDLCQVVMYSLTLICIIILCLVLVIYRKEIKWSVMYFIYKIRCKKSEPGQNYDE